jgi:hypothetical protein
MGNPLLVVALLVFGIPVLALSAMAASKLRGLMRKTTNTAASA